ncbi:hypothetical protein ACLOJK_033341 [Asimina triloba]
MGIQLLALAKLKLVAGGGGGAAHGPALILLKSLMWLFVIKIPFTAAIFGSYPDVASSSSFFLFRLTRILFQDPSLSRGGRRWDRAVRLIRSRAVNVRHQEAEASLHQLSMISL